MQTYYYFNDKLNQYVLISHIDNESKVLEWFATKGFNNLKTRCHDGTFRVVIPNDDRVLAPIKSKFAQGQNPDSTTLTQWVDETHIELSIPKQEVYEVIDWIDKSTAKHSIDHVFISFEYSDRIAELLKKYPPVNPAPTPAPQPKQPPTPTANASPKELTVEQLTRALNQYSHFRLNRIGQLHGLGDISALDKGAKIAAVCAALHKKSA